MKVGLPFRYVEDGVIDIYVYPYMKRNLYSKIILLPIIIIMGTNGWWRKEKQDERKITVK